MRFATLRITLESSTIMQRFMIRSPCQVVFVLPVRLSTRANNTANP
jgi:hypothetical protein